jgi:hypothetical protein
MMRLASWTLIVCSLDIPVSQHAECTGVRIMQHNIGFTTKQCCLINKRNNNWTTATFTDLNICHLIFCCLLLIMAYRCHSGWQPLHLCKITVCWHCLVFTRRGHCWRSANNFVWFDDHIVRLVIPQTSQNIWDNPENCNLIKIVEAWRSGLGGIKTRHTQF